MQDCLEKTTEYVATTQLSHPTDGPHKLSYQKLELYPV